MADVVPSRVLPCPVSKAITVLQEKWVLHIVKALLEGPRGFNELGREVQGCNPSTLTQRLARLEEVGLVRRCASHDCVSRGAYTLTASGLALRDVFDALHDWSLTYFHSSAEGPHAVSRGDGERPASLEVAADDVRTQAN